MAVDSAKLGCLGTSKNSGGAVQQMLLLDAAGGDRFTLANG